MPCACTPRAHARPGPRSNGRAARRIRARTFPNRAQGTPAAPRWESAVFGRRHRGRRHARGDLSLGLACTSRLLRRWAPWTSSRRMACVRAPAPPYVVVVVVESASAFQFTLRYICTLILVIPSLPHLPTRFLCDILLQKTPRLFFIAECDAVQLRRIRESHPYR